MGFSFKFLPYEKFDVSRVAPLQLDLNATFVAGGVAPKAQLDDPGKVAFSFLQQDRTTKQPGPKPFSAPRANLASSGTLV